LIGGEEDYEIVYKFHKSKNIDEWLIYDVEMLGVSIMKTYRNQFKEYLATNSFDNLLIKLKTKIETKTK
jgi:phospholipid transport system substrate-binding protein